MVKRGQCFSRAQDRAAQRMIGPEVRDEDFVHQIVRSVLDHVDFFHDDVALAIQFLVAEQRRGNQVRQQIKGAREVFVEDFDVIAGHLAAGERVDVAPYRVAFYRDFAGGAITGAFEQRVFDEVRNAIKVFTFVARTRPHPNTDGRGAHLIHLLGYYGQAIVEDGLFDHSSLSTHRFTNLIDASTRLKQQTRKRQTQQSQWWVVSS